MCRYYIKPPLFSCCIDLYNVHYIDPKRDSSCKNKMLALDLASSSYMYVGLASALGTAGTGQQKRFISQQIPVFSLIAFYRLLFSHVKSF